MAVGVVGVQRDGGHACVRVAQRFAPAQAAVVVQVGANQHVVNAHAELMPYESSIGEYHFLCQQENRHPIDSLDLKQYFFPLLDRSNLFIYQRLPGRLLRHIA